LRIAERSPIGFKPAELFDYLPEKTEAGKAAQKFLDQRNLGLLIILRNEQE
jgi:hypothetical protein